METVHITFEVTVAEHSHVWDSVWGSVWDSKEMGEAELEFDMPVSMVGKVNMSEILQGLLLVAYQNYLDRNKEEE